MREKDTCTLQKGIEREAGQAPNFNKLTEYLNSQNNPAETMAAILWFCKPSTDHLSNRDQEAEVAVS